MSKYMSLEQTIRKLGAKTASQPMEKDMNDQVHAGSYSSKHFEVSAPAQKLYASLPKEVNPDDAEKSVQLHDKLFAIHKKTAATERSTSSDVKDAQRLHDEIMKLAKDMGLEDKHGHVKNSLEHIKKYVDTQVDPKDEVTPEDVSKRFATPPKDYQTDVKADADIDNIARFRITRDKKGQRKLKIIDDEYNLGATKMDRIENVSPSFLEALKQVQENAQEIAEKKKMTKADIAALKEPKGSIDADDLAALRAGEHKKKKVEEGMLKDIAKNTLKNVVSDTLSKTGGAFGKAAAKAVEKKMNKEETEESALETFGEAVRSIARASRTWADKKTSSDIAKKHSKKGYRAPGVPSKEEMRKKGEEAVKSYMAKGGKIRKEETELEELDEAQFVLVQKGMNKKRIRNNPTEIMQARKDGWAIREEVETVDEANELNSLAKSQASATVKREVGQKKALFAKKNAVDKQKFSKSMQSIKAGDEVEMGGEPINEAAFKLTDAHKSAITKHLKNNLGKGKVTFHSEHGGHFATHSDGIQSTVHHAEMKNGKLTLSHFMTMDEEIDYLDEVLDTDEKKMQYAKKASDQIKAYKERGGAYDMSSQGEKDAKGVEKRTKGLQRLVKKIQKKTTEEVDYLDEVLDTDEKKMQYAKKASDQIKAYKERGGAYDTSAQGEKDAKGVEKRTKGLQSLIKKIQKKTTQESFMERAIAILGEEYAELSFEELVEEVKRARGRPRKNPPKDPNAPKRPRGRPKKGSSPASTSSSSAASTTDTDKDREHIVMALRKSISSRGQHHVKFADGNSHQVPAEHAQKALKMHDSLNRPSEKMVFARKLAASHTSFKKALDDKNPGSEETKKTGITLAKRAD